jgi:hypothetical protein
MSDIVKQLHNIPSATAGWPGEEVVDQVAYAAAAEIERLRARLAEVQTCPNCGLAYTAYEGEELRSRLAEAEALLRDINAADRHLTDGAWWVVLYQDHYDRIDAFLAPKENERE